MYLKMASKYLVTLVLVLVLMLVIYIYTTTPYERHLDLIEEYTPQNLDAQGYMIMRNVIPLQAIRDIRKSITGTRVNYWQNKEFIDLYIIPIVKAATRWASPSYYKFRTSNNNNSSDAGVFHRDLNNFTTTKEIWPIYTCVCYIDGGIMELIPGTYKTPAMDNYQCYKSFFKTKIIHLDPGDLLLFHCLTIHRGIFSDKMVNRRLIQVFEIYPTAEIREKYSKKVIKKKPIQSKTYNLGQKINIWCHKNYLLSSFLNVVGYIYASKRLVYPQYKFTKKELNSDIYISHKATQQIKPQPGKYYPSNRYVLNEKVQEEP